MPNIFRFGGIGPDEDRIVMLLAGAETKAPGVGLAAEATPRRGRGCRLFGDDCAEPTAGLRPRIRASPGCRGLFIRIGPYPSNMRFLPQWSVSLASSTCDHPVLCNGLTAHRYPQRCAGVDLVSGQTPASGKPAVGGCRVQTCLVAAIELPLPGQPSQATNIGLCNL